MILVMLKGDTTQKQIDQLEVMLADCRKKMAVKLREIER